MTASSRCSQSAATGPAPDMGSHMRGTSRCAEWPSKRRRAMPSVRFAPGPAITTLAWWQGEVTLQRWTT